MSHHDHDDARLTIKIVCIHYVIFYMWVDHMEIVCMHCLIFQMWVDHISALRYAVPLSLPGWVCVGVLRGISNELHYE